MIIRVAPTIPTRHSCIWCSPRFDPKKLRETRKLNLSTEVFLTRTSLSKAKPTNVVLPFCQFEGIVLITFFLTVAVVLRHGSKQSDTWVP